PAVVAVFRWADTAAELVRLGPELGVGELLDLVLERVHDVDELLQSLDPAAVATAHEFLEWHDAPRVERGISTDYTGRSSVVGGRWERGDEGWRDVSSDRRNGGCSSGPVTRSWGPSGPTGAPR